MNEEETEAEYFSKDFEWETLKHEVESNPSFQYHLLPFNSSQRQHEIEDSKAWQRFHVRHSSGKFFKERRYLLKEFPELVSCGDFSRVLEVGCGNGSSVIPILRGNKNVIVYACDCSAETLQKAKEVADDAANIVSVQYRFKPFCCDFALSGFPKWLFCNSCKLAKKRFSSDVRETRTVDVNGSYSLEEDGCCIGGVDFVTLIFTLSAVPLQRMPTALLECFSVLKPGGLLFFRDYGNKTTTMNLLTEESKICCQ